MKKTVVLLHGFGVTQSDYFMSIALTNKNLN